MTSQSTDNQNIGQMLLEAVTKSAKPRRIVDFKEICSYDDITECVKEELKAGFWHEIKTASTDESHSGGILSTVHLIRYEE